MLTLLPRSGGATGRAETRGRLLKWIRERSPRLKRKHGRNGNTTFVINERKNVPAGMKQRQNRPRASWMHLFPARRNTHIYGRKGVPALGDMRQTRSGLLLLPVRDISGTLQSLQYIAPDGTKRFLTGGKVQGGHFIIPGKVGKASSPLRRLCYGSKHPSSRQLHRICDVLSQ